MPKIRDYANAENLGEALQKEGLLYIPFRADLTKGTRVKPVFLLTIGNPEHDAIVTRLAKEGFEWEASLPEVPATEPVNHQAAAYAAGLAATDPATFGEPDTVVSGDAPVYKDPETDPPPVADDAALLAELDALATPDETDNDGGAGNQHGQNPGPDGLNLDPIEPDDVADLLAGLTLSNGDYLRVTTDEDGKVLSAEKVEPPAPVEDELPEADTDAIAGWLGGRDPKSLPRLANGGLSDLFFNYGVDGGFNPEAVADRAEDFAASVLNAFGVAVDPEELVSDYFARL